MRLRVLTDQGIQEFASFLDRLRSGVTLPVPAELLDAEGSSRAISANIHIQDRDFKSRQDAAEYLDDAFAPLEHKELDDRGLWAWLSLFWFDRLCPADSKGRRKPGRDYRHIPSTHRWYYYRHLLLGPWQILRACRPAGRALLCGAFGSHGDFAEQLASRQELVVNRGLMELVDRLYFDAPMGRTKSGSTDRKKPGSLRRLVALVNQLDLTYDLYAMSADELQALLPREFDRWLGS